MSSFETYEGMKSALESAARQDEGIEQAPVTPPQAPEPVTEAPTPNVEAATPEAPQTPVEDSFIPRADLDSLLDGIVDPVARERVETAYKSFQGGFTKKTQELAEQRRQYESLGDPADLQEALRLYNSVQDPVNWPAIHAELTQALQQVGMTPAQANAEAATQVQAAQVAQPEPTPEWSEEDPAFEYARGLEARLNDLQASMDARAFDEQNQRRELAMEGEVIRQENIVRNMNPNYDDDDLARVYELSHFYNGNLIDANERYKEITAAAVSRYVGQKTAVENTPGIQAIPGANVTSEQPTPTGSIRDAEKLALDWIRGLDANQA